MPSLELVIDAADLTPHIAECLRTDYQHTTRDLTADPTRWPELWTEAFRAATEATNDRGWVVSSCCRHPIALWVENVKDVDETGGHNVELVEACTPSGRVLAQQVYHDPLPPRPGRDQCTDITADALHALHAVIADLRIPECSPQCPSAQVPPWGDKPATWIDEPPF
ncbi:hypothetical protein [Nocardia sp. NPDC003963]